jgi:tetratricopeptide (TPR) repeat protein
MSRLFRRLSLCCIAVALSLTGCATHMIRLQPVRAAFQRGDVAEADRLLADELEQRSGEEDLLLLDRAMVTLADGRPADAERMLRRARDSFDQLEEESSAETTWSMLSDDDARAYHGEDYEKVLVRAMLALSNLVQDGDDAEAYSLQVIDKQQRIVAAAAQPDGTNPKASYQQVALAPYLRGLLREETHRDYDDAARNFQLVVDWQPDFRPGRAHLARAAGGSHSRRGHGVVHVFALVGHGPFKAEVEEMPTSTSLLIADQILSTQLGTTLPPTVAPIKVPRIVAAPGAAGTVQVAVGDWAAGQTETITDVSQMAIRQQEALLPTTLARAVARRTVKKGTIYGVKQEPAARPHSGAAAGTARRHTHARDETARSPGTAAGASRAAERDGGRRPQHLPARAGHRRRLRRPPTDQQPVGYDCDRCFKSRRVNQRPRSSPRPPQC